MDGITLNYKEILVEWEQEQNSNLYNIQIIDVFTSDIIIDIVAHIGMFSIYAAQFCKAGKIFCVASFQSALSQLYWLCQ